MAWTKRAAPIALLLDHTSVLKILPQCTALRGATNSMGARSRSENADPRYSKYRVIGSTIGFSVCAWASLLFHAPLAQSPEQEWQSETDPRVHIQRLDSSRQNGAPPDFVHGMLLQKGKESAEHVRVSSPDLQRRRLVVKRDLGGTAIPKTTSQ